MVLVAFTSGPWTWSVILCSQQFIEYSHSISKSIYVYYMVRGLLVVAMIVTLIAIFAHSIKFILKRRVKMNWCYRVLWSSPVTLIENIAMWWWQALGCIGTSSADTTVMWGVECRYSIFHSLRRPRGVQVYQIQDSRNVDKIQGQMGVNLLVKG